LSCNCRLAGSVPLLCIPSCSIDLIGSAERRLRPLHAGIVRPYRGRLHYAIGMEPAIRWFRARVRSYSSARNCDAAGHQLDARCKRAYGLHRRLAQPFAGKQHAGGTDGFDDYPSQSP
jgi:hypothetical protein